MHNEDAVSVLLVEDSPSDAYLVEAMLGQIPGRSYVVQHVVRLSDAQAVITTGTSVDVILLDLSLPDAQGIETISEMAEIAPDLPIIVMTGNSDPNAMLTAVQSGAQDFLLKGESDSRFLDKTIRYAIEHKRTERHLSRLAHYDALTGLANRALFHDNLQSALARAKRSEQYMGLLFLDLDRFKLINDTLGHGAGDELLREVANRIQNVIRKSDAAARLGGDEFTIILEGIETVSSAEVAAKKILNALAEPYILNHHPVIVSPSIGIAVYPANGEDEETLLRNADIAMYRSKEQGGNTYQVHHHSINSHGLARLDMERDLRHAIVRNEFVLHYQPIVACENGNVLAAEALLRWNSPLREGLVPPNEFIPILEETGMIGVVGEWVLRTACKQCKAWHVSGASDLRISVNVSARQLRAPRTVDWIARALEESGLDARFLDLEITESTLIDQSQGDSNILEQIHTMGVSLSIDDFGTGYSSLSYLTNYHMDTLKIDRSFLCDITTNNQTATIVKAIIAMAHGLGLRVIAEGIEEQEQLEFLQSLDCDEIQGFLFSRPLEAQALLNYATESTTAHMKAS